MSTEQEFTQTLVKLVASEDAKERRKLASELNKLHFRLINEALDSLAKKIYDKVEKRLRQ